MLESAKLPWNVGKRKEDEIVRLCKDDGAASTFGQRVFQAQLVEIKRSRTIALDRGKI